MTEQGTVTEHGCGIIRIQSEKSIKYEIHKYVINVPSYNLFEHSKTLYYNFPNFLLEIKNKNLLFFSLFFFYERRDSIYLTFSRHFVADSNQFESNSSASQRKRPSTKMAANQGHRCSRLPVFESLVKYACALPSRVDAQRI